MTIWSPRSPILTGLIPPEGNGEALAGSREDGADRLSARWCHPSSCRTWQPIECRGPFQELLLITGSGGTARTALSAGRAHRGTGSSNPSPSSRQSLSRRISPSCIARPAVAAAWAGPARRHGRQRRAGLVNITPIAGDISVERYSGTAVPARRFATCKRGRVSGVTRRGPAQAKPSTLRCSCQPSGRRECASSLSAVRSRGCRPSRMASVMSGAR